MLRPYQQRAIDELYAWFRANPKGNPCLVLPTGSGKSHIVAALCKDALSNWPSTRVLMLTHVKELIEQNAEKMREHWRNAPMGVYSASIGKRQLGEPITFAGIQSVRTRASQLGHIDLIVIDECHLVNHKDEGSYRKLIADLRAINPSLRVVGLTATPYRLGFGLITDGTALFHDLIEPVSIEELVYKGFLSTLRSKVTETHFDLSGVHKRGGEYIEGELALAVDTDDNNSAVVSEVIRLAGDRKAWLFFCSGVRHARNIAALLNAYGIPAACITGDTPKAERAQIIADYKSGKYRALTNANVLTTGFDYPDIDLIAMLRPTMSASLYVQMAGRGMRVKSHTDHCLVLDFAGVVAQHGPITAVKPRSPKQRENGEKGEAPVKICDNCAELVAISAKECPACGLAFPEPEKKKLKLHDDDIMKVENYELEVRSWRWSKHTSRASGMDMLAVSYYGGLSDPIVTEYITILHDGYAGQKARRTIGQIAHAAGVALLPDEPLDDFAKRLYGGRMPNKIVFRRDGKYHRVLDRVWEHEAAEA
jgi:DNA repair protein RadD